MSKYNITKHGKERLRERSEYSRSSEIHSLFARALKSGKSPADLNEPLASFCRARLSNGAQIKVYSGMIFIYRGKTLITAYGVPDKYMIQVEVDKYIKSNHKKVYELKANVLLERIYKDIENLIVEMYIPKYDLKSIAILNADLKLSLKCLTSKLGGTEKYVKPYILLIKRKHEINTKNLVVSLYTYLSVLRCNIKRADGFGFRGKKTKGEKKSLGRVLSNALVRLDDSTKIIDDLIIYHQSHIKEE